jgi:hypothetical protein
MNLTPLKVLEVNITFVDTPYFTNYVCNNAALCYEGLASEVDCEICFTDKISLLYYAIWWRQIWRSVDIVITAVLASAYVVHVRLQFNTLPAFAN